MLGHISPYIKIAAWFIAILLLIWLLIPFRSWSEKLLSQNHRYCHLITKQRAVFILSIFPILVIAILLFVFAFHPLVNLETSNKAIGETGNLTPTHIRQPNTVVRCCLRGNTYQIWPQNEGDKQDSVVITLSTSSPITGFHAIGGASLPTIIQGGIHQEFIAFKIDELIPRPEFWYVYTVDTYYTAEQPYGLTAWSDETGDLQAIALDKCPEIIAVGPEETIRP